MPVVKSRFYIFVAVIFLIIIILIAAAASTASNKVKTQATPIPPPPPPPPPTVLTYTIASGVGVKTVQVTNENSGSTMTLTAMDLPATFNCKPDDTLTFKVTANSGYRFNAWLLGDGTFQSSNPYTIKAAVSFNMEARFLIDSQSPNSTG